MIGFSSIVNGGAPWTRTKVDEILFNDPNILPLISELTITESTHTWNGFGPQWTGFELAGGMRIYGMGGAGTSSVNAVPAPAAAWLFGSGLIGLVGFARRKK